MILRPAAFLAAWPLAVFAAACNGKSNQSTVLVNVSAESAVAGILQLRAAFSNGGTQDTKAFPQQPNATPLVFPTSFSVTLPTSRIGTLEIVIDGIDTAKEIVANGAGNAAIEPGGKVEVTLTLAAGAATCGNHMPDPGEECDDGNRTSGDGCSFMCKRDLSPDAGTPPMGDGGDRPRDTANSADTPTDVVPDTHSPDVLTCTPMCAGKCSGPDTCNGTCQNNCKSPEICGARTSNVCGMPPCIAEIAAGANHTCVRKGDGALWCWGLNTNGQVGDGTTTTPRLSPVRITALATKVVQVAASDNDTCARLEDGTLWCWGSNNAGQVGDGTMDTPKPSPVEVTTLGTAVTQVVTGEAHTCGLKKDGSLWCWGDNSMGQVGDGTMANHRLTPVQVTSLGSLVAEVAAGSLHTCARKQDGTVWCWGLDDNGQIGDGAMTGPRLSAVQVTALGVTSVELSAGGRHTCARKQDGTLWCWGYNNGGQIGDGTTTLRPTPVQVTALGATVTQVSVGVSSVCARKQDGTLWCWGANDYGQVGDGTTTTPRTSPLQVALGTTVAGVGVGDYHSCARKQDDTLWCWGANAFGAVGDGTTTTPRSSPIQALLTCP